MAWAQCITLLLNLGVHVLYLTLGCQGFKTVIGRSTRNSLQWCSDFSFVFATSYIIPATLKAVTASSTPTSKHVKQFRPSKPWGIGSPRHNGVLSL